MNKEFNLITSNWIPVIANGTAQSKCVGIGEAIEKAHQLQAVSATTPLDTAATYRLLLVVLQAAMEITDVTWRSLWKDRSFRCRDIQDYFDRWTGRFNLFDREYPFYQDVTLATKPESVSSLRGHLASGADATLFSHNTQQQRLSLTADEAALALLSIQAFGLSGTKGGGRAFTDAPCARGMVLFIEGSSLFETLLLNLFDRDLRYHRLKRQNNDRPGWEMDNPFLDDPRRPYGLLDHLTWHNRRVRLILDDQDSHLTVQNMMYDIGLRTSDTAKKTVRDIFSPLYYWRANARKKEDDDGRTHFPLSFEQEKALWRDSAVLFQVKKTRADDADKPPAALEQAQMLAQDGVLSWTDTFRLQAFGACTKPPHDKTYFYRQETLPLPVSILRPDDTSLIGHLSEALGAAQRACDAVTAAVSIFARLVLKPSLPASDLSFAPKKEEQGRIVALSDSWGVQRTFWSDLEPYFHRLIQDLPDQPEVAVQTWQQIVRKAANDAFDQAESYAGGDLRALRAAALARQMFYQRLANALGKASTTDNTNGDDNL